MPVEIWWPCPTGGAQRPGVKLLLLAVLRWTQPKASSVVLFPSTLNKLEMALELEDPEIPAQDLAVLAMAAAIMEKRCSGCRTGGQIPVFLNNPFKGVSEPFVPLTDEDEDRVHHALCGRKRREKLSVHEASNIVITREILQCLNDKDWLNDEVINLYLELLKERELREPNKFVKCHFFNTFFYKKLINGGYDYKAVRRWTTKRKLGYNLIDCDKIFVPIHKEVHWCLAVINVRDKMFQYLDSLGSMDMKALKLLATYLVDEVKDKNGKQIDVLSWKQDGVQNLPLQENGWDCGMFMLKYIDFYSRDMDLIFGQKHMSYFRRRTAKEILDLRAG